MDHHLDLRGLPPPEPLEQIIDALTDLPPGDRLRVTLHREPIPLYGILQNLGYAWSTHTESADGTELLIWPAEDDAQRRAAADSPLRAHGATRPEPKTRPDTMHTLNVETRKAQQTRETAVAGWQPFALGFRPFFLLAGLSAATLMLLWLLSWHGAPSHAVAYYGHIAWHSHEMLFGFTSAVIAGFLLTAVRNWTGLHTPDGVQLALLALLWLGGRALPFWEAAPHPLIAIVELAFLPVLAAALTKPLWQGANKNNRWFIALLLAMTLANGLVHAQALGWTTDTASRGVALMLTLTLVLLVFVGGRVMPFFTEKAIPGSRPRAQRWVEIAGVASLLGIAALQSFGVTGGPVGALLLVAGGVQLVRLAGWYDRRIWQIPILWVLYAGYGWLAIGLLMLGGSELGLVLRSSAVHALTVGAIGVFTLGMMARVSLGHTGRMMRSSPAINAAFATANLAAAIRVLGPAFAPAWYVSWIMLSGALWVIAFALFAAVYTPVLLRARIDGRPG